MKLSLEGEILQGFCYAKKEVRDVPSRPKHPCAYSGCPNLTDRRYCPEHEKLMNSNYEKYDRDKVKKRRYGRAWKRIRDRYAAEHPFCEICYERGILVPVEEVHHKLPLAEGGTHDRSNLISLCKSCHSRIHAERGDRWGKYKKGLHKVVHSYRSAEDLNLHARP
jgi:5-methylcytosine-specific restriction protein A